LANFNNFWHATLRRNVKKTTIAIVLLKVYYGTILPIFITIGSYLRQGAKDKLAGFFEAGFFDTRCIITTAIINNGIVPVLTQLILNTSMNARWIRNCTHKYKQAASGRCCICCQSMHIYVKNNPAKFHPDSIWNDGTYLPTFRHSIIIRITQH